MGRKPVSDTTSYRWKWLFHVLSRVPNLTDSLSCWEWPDLKNEHGYGLISYLRTPTRVHRFVYETIHGPTDLFVLHKCDNPACFNPNHLFAGTQTDNMQDCSRKGRVKYPRLRGERHPMAKLPDAGVTAILQRLLNGEAQVSLAREYGVSQSVISLIKLGKRKAG